MRHKTNEILMVLEMADAIAHENEKQVEHETAYTVVEADLADLLSRLRGDARVRHLAQTNEIHDTSVRAIHLHYGKGYHLWLREDGVPVKTPATERVTLENTKELSARDLVALHGPTAIDLFRDAFADRRKQEEAIKHYGEQSVQFIPVRH